MEVEGRDHQSINQRGEVIHSWSDESPALIEKDSLKPFTNEELGEKLKELLEKRLKLPDGPDIELEFDDLFDELKSLSLRMPSGFTFNVATYGPRAGHPVLQNMKAMKCFNSNSQLNRFLQRVSKVLKELQDDSREDPNDSRDMDDRRNDTSAEVDLRESKKNDSSEEVTDKSDKPKDSQEKDKDDDHILRKRDAKSGHLDWDDLFEKLEEDDLECLSGFVNDNEEKFLCARFSRGSAGIFRKILSSGFDCDDHLDDASKEDHDDDDNDDDDRLSESHQIAILNRLKTKDSREWTDDDVKKVLRLTPDVIDDDFLEDLPENLLKMHMQQFVKIAFRQNGNPGLRYILREKMDVDFEKMTTDSLRQMGPGLMALRFDQLQRLDGKLFLEVDTDREDDDDSKEKDDKEKKVKVDDDDDDDDDDDKKMVRFAIGQRIKSSLNVANMTRVQLGRAMHYLHDDLDFIRKIEPDDLLDALKDIRNIDYDDDDARAVLAHMAHSVHFPQLNRFTGSNLTAMGHLVRGFGVYQLAELQKKVIEESLDTIKDIDFDDDQAQELIDDLLDDDKVESLDLEGFRKLGKLVRGIPTGQLMKIKPDVLDDLLDDLDDVDLSDAQKRVVAGLALQNKKTHRKLLRLNSFLEVLSVSDLEDIDDDDDVIVHLNVTAKLDWTPPQAAVLAHKYLHRQGANRLRPADVGSLGQLALGLHPDDLDDMMKTTEDVLDLADELKDMEDELTSGQIDELVDTFSDLTELSQKEFEIDDIKAVQSAHILAYLSKEKFAKLKFTPTGQVTFLNQMSKMATNKMSRDHMHFLATAMLKIMGDDDSKELKNDDRDARRLRSFGQLALGLSPEQLEHFSAIAILDNLDILRTLPLTKLQAKVILDKMDDIAEKWHCRPDIMARLGPILLHDENPLSDDCDWDTQKGLLGSFKVIVKSLEKRKEMIQERLEEGFSREDNDDDDDDIGEKRLVSAMVLLATQTTKPVARRRRAAQAPLTCDILMMLRGSAKQVNEQLLTTMKDEDFINCLSTLGSIRDWPVNSMTALINKAKVVLKDVKTWTNEQIRRLGSLVSGLTPAEILELQLTGVDALNSVGRHRLLSVEQLRSGFTRWMNLTGKLDVTQISDGEFSALSEFVCALDVSEIDRVNATTFKRSVAVIGTTVSCTDQQHKAYIQKAVSVFGADINMWRPAVVGDLGHLLAGFSPDQIKKINSKQLSLIEPRVIPSLPKELVSAMSVEQLKALSTNQANAVTQVQYEALTAEQRKLVDSKASLVFSTHTTSTPGHPKDQGGNGATLTSLSISLIISTFLISSL
ncbi:hypothetical protein Btru_055274 [Bulinus truncatus]|nr:hypothetical protein Btru_055274 [Bulinus truncatus]